MRKEHYDESTECGGALAAAGGGDRADRGAAVCDEPSGDTAGGERPADPDGTRCGGAAGERRGASRGGGAVGAGYRDDAEPVCGGVRPDGQAAGVERDAARADTDNTRRRV